MAAFPPSSPLLADFPLPNEFWTTEPAELEEFGKDWTKVFAPRPAAIVFPRTTAHVSTVLRWANERGIAVVPSGGRTGLAGGAVAKNGEVVLSLARMGRMDPVDVLGQTVRVQAGAVTEAVHHHCEAHGLTWPVDFASKGSSQVGGNIATNAGGVKVIRYGLTRQWVLGLEVVLASGDVLELGGALEKNNTGVDLRQLFIGSEGILGVVTEATLKLTRVPAPPKVLLSPWPIWRRCCVSSGRSAAPPSRWRPTSSSPARAWTVCSATASCAIPSARPRATTCWSSWRT